MTRPTAVINRLAQDRPAVVGYHRFVNNAKVSDGRIMEGHYQHLAKRIKGKDLICIQDTTEYNYHHHKHLLKEAELGTISDNRSLGLRVHPMLVMDAQDRFPYGFSSIEIINRVGQTKTRHERKYKQLPIEQKESYRWIKSMDQAKERLKGANSLTMVADRESDIYELWSRAPDERTHLVIRTSFTRKFVDQDHQAITPTNALGLMGTYQIYVPGKPGQSDKGRTATLEVFAQQADTVKPRSLSSQKYHQYPDKIPLSIVTARETVPEGVTIKEPIEWILLTDFKIATLQAALEVIDIYKSRWDIEQFFRLTKQKGFGLEESQLETAHGLCNLMVLVFIAAIRIYQMLKCRNSQTRPATDVFEEHEIELLAKISPALEGGSEKSKNKNKPQNLAFFVWVIARLGNWKPEDRDPPGPITFKRGWEVFENYLRIAQVVPP